MNILSKRIYEAYSPDDGFRVLVDRLWPRGVRKEDAHIDLWAKELTPSSELRKWFHADPLARFEEFSIRYQLELDQNKVFAIHLIKEHPALTLITAAKDVEHSHIPVLILFLKSL